MADEPTGTEQTNANKGDENALGDAGKRALQTERDAREAAEKALKEANKKLEAIETAKLSDLEKSNKRAEDAEKRAAAAELTVHRSEAMRKHNLGDEFADFLTGTAEEIAAKAETLAKKFAEAKPASERRPDPTQGASGAGEKPSTAQAFADALPDF